MDGTEVHPKPSSERQTSHVFSHMWNLDMDIYVPVHEIDS
jgi:hypothetical protein